MLWAYTSLCFIQNEWFAIRVTCRKVQLKWRDMQSGWVAMGLD